MAIIIHVCLYCHNSASNAVAPGYRTGLEIQWLWVGILAGKALKQRHCTLEGKGRYVNVSGSLLWKGVCRVGERTLEV